MINRKLHEIFIREANVDSLTGTKVLLEFDSSLSFLPYFYQNEACKIRICTPGGIIVHPLLCYIQRLRRAVLNSNTALILCQILKTLVGSALGLLYCTVFDSGQHNVFLISHS